jgi:hypothetical protein
MPQAAALQSPLSRTQDCKKCLSCGENHDSVAGLLNL